MKKCFLSIILFTILSSPVFGKDSLPANHTNETVIEGTLAQVSKLPPAKENAYPDCYYTAVLDVVQIISGQSLPRKVVLVLPGFFGREYAPEAHYKSGDKVRATVVTFASMPDKVKQTQQADEIEDVDLAFYFPQKISPIQEFQKGEKPIPVVSKEQIKEKTATFQFIDQRAKQIRKATMQRDLEQIDKLLATHGGDWDKWYASLKDFRAEYQKQYDAKAQKWVGGSFFSAGKFDNGKIYSPQFINSVVALKNYLSARNIDLILIRVPHKGEIVDDLFASVPPDKVTNPYLLKLYKELLEADVEIITDIIPRAKGARLKYPLMFWYQDFEEFHPGEGIAWVVSQAFSERVRRYDINPTGKFTLEKEVHPKYKWPEGSERLRSTDYVTFSGVRYDTMDSVQITQGFDSKVLILGSSIIGFPDFGSGGSMSHYFAYLSGIVPDQLYRAGGDAMMLRNLAREGEAFLSHRVVCLFPVVAFTPYAPFKDLPTIDVDRSPKTLLESYSGPSLVDAIELSANTPKEAISYAQDGILNIVPINGRNAEAQLLIKVPAAVSGYPYFIMEVEFASKEITNIKATYAGKSDSIIRSDMQQNNIEKFSFEGKQERFIELEVATKYINPVYGDKPPTKIKQISFFAVKQPSFYK